jgi:hypothetical protein
VTGGRSSKGSAPATGWATAGSPKAWSSAGPLQGLDKDHAPRARSRFRAERCPAQAHGMRVPQRGSRTERRSAGRSSAAKLRPARGQMEQEPPAWLQPPSFHDAEPFGGIFGVGSQVELAHAAPRPPIPQQSTAVLGRRSGCQLRLSFLVGLDWCTYRSVERPIARRRPIRYHRQKMVTNS